jgi:hypothetical protein
MPGQELQAGGLEHEELVLTPACHLRSTFFVVLPSACRPAIAKNLGAMVCCPVIRCNRPAEGHMALPDPFGDAVALPSRLLVAC